jgi:hypothetical protein
MEWDVSNYGPLKMHKYHPDYKRIFEMVVESKKIVQLAPTAYTVYTAEHNRRGQTDDLALRP